MNFNMNDIKTLREETGAGVMEVKQVLESFNGDIEKAKAELMKKVASKAAKKADRAIKDGSIYAYIHNGGKIGSLISLGCETDFVAKTEGFKKLCHDIAMQVCTAEYANVDEVLASEYLKDESKKISDLINELTAKVGEKIELIRFVKFRVGE